MENDLIVIKQLPVIEDQLQAVKQSIEERVSAALALVCTEDTYKSIKKVRSELNKEYQELERRRKEVKTQILRPYESFEAVYKECAGDLYTKADAELKAKIGEVEDGIRSQKADELKACYAELRGQMGLDGTDLADFEKSGLKAQMSDSSKTLRDKASAYLQSVSDDLALIRSIEHSDEVMAEYRNTRNVSTAVAAVKARREQIERIQREREERQRMEAERQITEPETGVQTPEAAEAPQEAETPVATPVAEDAPHQGPRSVTYDEELFDLLDAMESVPESVPARTRTAYFCPVCGKEAGQFYVNSSVSTNYGVVGCNNCLGAYNADERFDKFKKEVPV